MEVTGNCFIEKLNEAYGTFINAVEYFAKHYSSLSKDDIDWKYLGPSCIRVKTSQVRNTPIVGFAFEFWSCLSRNDPVSIRSISISSILTIHKYLSFLFPCR
jgi:hypothetical protein